MKQFTIAMILMATLLSGSQVIAQETNEEIVAKFLHGFNNPDDLQKSFDLLSADYKFKNPMVSLNSKEQFIPLAQQIATTLTGVNVLTIVAKDEWVAAYYEFTSKIRGVESNIATEWFRIENGLIQESQLIYDASEWRKIYAQMGE